MQEMMLDGKPELMISARGVVLLALCGWKGDGLKETKDAMRRYYEYVSLRGFRSKADAAMTALEVMSMDNAKQWVQRTFAQYTQDQTALIQYVI